MCGIEINLKGMGKHEEDGKPMVAKDAVREEQRESEDRKEGVADRLKEVPNKANELLKRTFLT